MIPRVLVPPHRCREGATIPADAIPPHNLDAERSERCPRCMRLVDPQRNFTGLPSEVYCHRRGCRRAGLAALKKSEAELNRRSEQESKP